YTYVGNNGGATIVGVSPRSGFASGGTSVTITGSGFTSASAVSFGGLAASSFTVVSDTQITAVTAATTARTVHVSVTAGAGTSATSGADQFTFVSGGSAVVVTGVSPNSAPTSGGTLVTITGSGFSGAAGVSFGSTPAKEFTVVSDNQ